MKLFQPLWFIVLAELEKKSSYMKEGKCSKFFSKKFTSNTSINCDGFAIYRRRDTNIHIICKEVKLDSTFIVSIDCNF